MKSKSKKNFNSNTLLLVITIALFAVLYAGGCIAYGDRGFTHFQTFLNILITNAGLICVACGMTCVMLTGGIDISVGALIAMDCMMLAVGMSKGLGAVPMVLLVLVAGLSGRLHGDTAVYCIHGRHVLLPRNDGRYMYRSGLYHRKDQCNVL